MTSQIIEKSEQTLQHWSQQQHNAEAMVPIIGELYREHGIIVTVFGNSVVNKSPLEILEVHRLARVNVDDDICASNTYPILAAMAELDLGPARIDVATLASNLRARADEITVGDFVRDELAGLAVLVQETEGLKRENAELKAELARRRKNSSTSLYGTSRPRPLNDPR